MKTSPIYQIITLQVLLLICTSFYLHNPFEESDKEEFCQPPELTTTTDSIIGHIYFKLPNTSYCTPATIGTGVENVEITMTTLNNGQSTSGISDQSGRFAIKKPNSGFIKLEPTITDLSSIPLLNGISVFDVTLVNKHILKTGTLNCPFSRLAADFDFNGLINTTDVDWMNTYILGQNTSPYPFPIWKFIPNTTTFPSLIHPDNNFVSDFWNNAYSDVAGKEYPFDAELELFGQSYSYLGGTSWLQKVDKWDYSAAIEVCDLTDYGFWLIKSGDINRNAILSFSDPGQNLVTNNAYPIQYELLEENMSINPDKLYTISLKIKSQFSLDAYQLALKLDPEALAVAEINPITISVRQALKKHYNTQSEELAAGRIRTLWVIDYHNDYQGGANINDWTEIMNVTVELLDETINNKELEESIIIDTDLMVMEFVSSSKLIKAEDLNIKISILPRN